MADESKDGRSRIPKSIDDANANLIGPITKGIGNTLGDLWFLIFGGVTQKAEEKRMRIAASLECYKRELDAKMSAIPEECRQEPKLQIVGPALEHSKYCVEEVDLRAMFVNLISCSVDTRHAGKVHPSFSEIISQMSTLDAQNLMLFCRDNRRAIANYRARVNTGGHYTMFTNVFLDNKNETDISRVASSITALERFGLVRIEYSQYFTSESAYDAFLTHPICAECEQWISRLNRESTTAKCTGVDLQKGFVELTPFGQDFVDVCISPGITQS